MKLAYVVLGLIIAGAVGASAWMLSHPPVSPEQKCQMLKTYHEERVKIAEMCMMLQGTCVVTYSELEDLMATETAVAEACGVTNE